MASVRRTAGRESSSWPTPRASENDQGRAADAMAHGVSSWKAQGRGATLTTAVRRTEMMPTPVAYDATPGGPNNHYKGLGHQAKHLWPTPIATDGSKTPSGSLSRAVRPELRWSFRKGQKEKKWPTPLASDHLANDSETLEAWGKRAAKAKKEGVNLHFALRHAVQKWPTPAARDYKDAGQNTNYEKVKEKGKLAGAAGGALNPAWVEWLMGFPVGWTDCEPSGTPSSPRSRKKSGG